jgi:tetratricopeptide (TPR) repeat protein
LDEALAIDPDFALAHAAKAWYYAAGLTFTVFGSGADPARAAELENLVIEHASRAIALDPEVGLAHSALGGLYLYTWRWTESRRSFEKAIELQAGGVVAYVYVSCYQGRAADAIESVRRFMELNPTELSAYIFLGFAQLCAKDYDAAVESLRIAVELDPADAIRRVWLVTAEIARGDREAALRELERMEQERSTLQNFFPAVAAYAYARLGRAEDAERLAAEATQARGGAGGSVTDYLLAGDLSAALQRLELAAERAERHEPDPEFYEIMGLKPNVLRDPVLERPEFAAVFARIRGD